MEERTQRSKEGSSLPAVTLGVLAVVMIALLYIGYAYFMDDNAVTLTPQRVETNSVVDVGSESSTASDVPTPTAVEPDVIGDDAKAIDATPTVASSSEETAKPTVKPKPEENKTKGASSKGGAISYTVQGGQTFYSIASRYGMSESRLKEANPGVDPSKLAAGKTLKVPVYATHTVGSGDILRVVAQKYGVTVDALMKANGKTRNYAAKGEKLIIPYPKR
ncbi:MAG: LysM peptidoglycan-binding domain-containing protein [Siphonobacter sp.]